MKKIALFIAVFWGIIFFVTINYCRAGEDKEALAAYLKDVSSIVTNVDIMMRSIGFNTLPMTEGVRRMNIYIGQMELLNCPESTFKQYKMILLAFKKLRAGLLFFSLEKKDLAIGLIRSGTRLLKYAAKDILTVAEQEGIRKTGNITKQKGE